jgi:catalase
MPFPSDEELMGTARELVSGLQGVFGKHAGFRPGKQSHPAHHLSILTPSTSTRQRRAT